MSVRFIIGRAGTGKTHYCLQSVRENLKQSPVDGPRLIVLVPEQAALQTERSLLESGGVGAAHRAEALSFRRLAMKVLESTGGSDRMALSEPARAMVLRHLVHVHGKKLQYYRRVDRLGGFLERLGGTISELMQECVGPEELVRRRHGGTRARRNGGRSDEATKPRRHEGEERRRHGGTEARRHGGRSDEATEPRSHEGEERKRHGGTKAQRNEGEEKDWGDDPLRAAKLADVARLYRAYLDYLGDSRVDPTQYLDLARERIARCGWLSGALLWMDGFASVSRQEMRILLELGKVCRRVEICLMGDPGAMHTAGRSGGELESLRLFRRLEETREDLEQAFAEAGVEIESPLLLKGRPGRFRDGSMLATMEARWTGNGECGIVNGEGIEKDDPHSGPCGTGNAEFGIAEEEALGADARVETGGSEERPQGGASGDAPYEGSERAREASVIGRTAQAEACGSLGGIELVELPTRRVEVEYAVSRICQWLRGEDGAPPHRLRDTAIIVRDLEPYHDLITAALSARNIPHFIDRRRPIGHHPIVELLRCAVKLVVDDLPLDSMRTLLKTGLLPLGASDADALENALIARGIEGIEAWRQAWPAWTEAGGDRGMHREQAYEEALAAQVNQARESILGVLEPWLDVVQREAVLSGPAWAEAIRSWLKHLNAAGTLAAWSTEAERRGDADEANEHRQAWRDVAAFLDDLEGAFAETELATEELARVLEHGLAALTLGLAPPMVDQVLVGSIERSRHPNIRSAVLLGFNDGMFPRRIAEDAILNDEDRTFLRGRGLRVAPPSRERLLDERLLVYIALTRPSERMVITWAAADDDGRALRASPFVEAVKGSVAGLETASVGDPVRTRSFWDIQTIQEAARRIGMEMRNRPSRAEDEEGVRGAWNGLYESLRGEMKNAECGMGNAERTGGEEDGSSGDAPYELRALGAEREARLTAESVQTLFGGTLRMSVSQLESYAACPFQHFARFSLRLRERQTSEMAAVDMGRVHHAVLERTVQEIISRKHDLVAMDEDALGGVVEDVCAAVGKELEDAARVSQARDRYQLRRTAEELRRILQAQRRIAGAGRMRPAAVELGFGFDEPGSLPALEVSTPNGRKMLVRGYIDRVDLADLAGEMLGVVIDYKRTRHRTLDLGQVFHGLSLQLPAYLLVLAARGEALAGRPVRPVGAFFVTLERTYQSVVHPDAKKGDDDEDPASGVGKPRGVLLGDHVDVLEMIGSGGQSACYNFRWKKDGDIAAIDRSDGADAAGFDKIMAIALRRIGELGDAMIDGRVEVRPFRMTGTTSPCTWCKMMPVCRFEFAPDRVRYLERLGRKEVMGGSRHEGT
ncbi:MAG: exodeoxyribonuclease V subunit gamma [Phycisphaerae bacterium]|nr:exodeoxyribonuclease V subunit gamma [Phycisphaerae bacterium]